MSLNDAHSFALSLLRGGRGFIARREGARPEQLPELFEFEACPYCRKVRETMSELDLAYVSRPCAKGSAKRPGVHARGGKTMFPYLVDPNTGQELYESEDIIDYLHARFGSGRPRPLRWLSPLNTLGASLAGIVRPKGRVARRPRPEQPPELLELYNFEASPYCRKVREVLNELDLDHVVHNVAKRSARRPELVERGGKMMVPYLIDPNTGSEMYESDDIISYLEATYA